MKKTDTIMKIVSVLALLAIVCYIGYYIYDARENPLRTVAAMEYTVTETAETEGYAVRSEKLLTDDRSRVTVVAGEGEKLAADSVYALRFESGESMGLMDRLRSLNARVEWLRNVVDGGEGAADRMARESVAALSHGVDSGNMGSVRDLTEDVRVKVFQSESFTDENLEASLRTAEEELHRLEAEMDSGVDKLRTDEPGVFSAAADGFEWVTPEKLADITPKKLEELFKNRESTTEAIGKLVTDIRWRYAAVMAEDEAMRLRPEDTVTLQFTKNVNETMKMTVESRSKPSLGKCVVVFISDRNLRDFLRFRDLTADMLISETSGIRVPAEAIREEERETENGNGGAAAGKVKYIYIVSGVQAEKVEVNVLGEYEGFCLVERNMKLRNGTEIITEAKDLYDGKVVR